MDSERFDALARVLARGISRRGALAGLAALTGIGLAPIDDAAAKKKKRKKRKKKTPIRPKSPPPCVRTCAGKPPCAGDGCGGVCGSCQNGSCNSGRCVCPFSNPCDPASGNCSAPCSPGFCCPNGTTCINGECGLCPENFEPCDTELDHVCGTTTDVDHPLCLCVKSVDGVRTCTSSFTDLDAQDGDCESDDECVGLLGFGVNMVCVDVPCLPFSTKKVCMNQGCVNLNDPGATSQSEGDAPTLRQLDWRSRK